MATDIITAHHVAFLESRGYHVNNVDGAKKYVAGLEKKERVAFFAEAAEWKQPKPAATETKPPVLMTLNATPATGDKSQTYLTSSGVYNGNKRVDQFKDAHSALFGHGASYAPPVRKVPSKPKPKV